MKKIPSQDKLEATVLDLYVDAKEYIERHELGGYITKHNEPRLQELNDSDTVDVQDVLMIGGYMTLRRLLRDISKQKKPDVNVSVLGGDSLPPHVRKAIVDSLKAIEDAMSDNEDKE